MKLLRRPPRKGSLREIFDSLKAGDIRQFPFGEVNVSSLRTRAGELNVAAGYSKYTVSVDSLLNTVRIMCNG